MKKIGVGTFETTDRIREYVNDVLDKNRLSYGEYSRTLESRFSEIHGCDYGVLSNSGTSSLQVALQAMKELHGWSDGSEVIIPAVTFVATANIVLHNRMVPVPVDVDHLTYNIDPEMIERAVTRKTRAIIPVHLFGQPADMTSIMRVAELSRLMVIEDSCESMFASHDGYSVGSIGDIGCFSMYVAHLVTAGVGGLSITNNPNYAAKMRSLVNHGRDGIYIDIDTEATKEVVSRRFKFDSVGHSFRVTELEAAIALAQLEDGYYSSMIKRRQENANVLTLELESLTDKIQLPHVDDKNTHSFMMYPIVVRDDDKWGLCNHLEDNGIETREMLPLINQPAYSGIFNSSAYPVANWINRGGFYVGCHQGLNDNDMIYIADVIREYFNQ